jgi:hypothetical protein
MSDENAAEDFASRVSKLRREAREQVTSMRLAQESEVLKVLRDNEARINDLRREEGAFVFKGREPFDPVGVEPFDDFDNWDNFDNWDDWDDWGNESSAFNPERRPFFPGFPGFPRGPRPPAPIDEGGPGFPDDVTDPRS